MSQPPYHDPYRINPNPVNTTSSLNQPGVIGTTGTTYTTGTTHPTGTYVQPTSTYQPTNLQPTTQGHGLLHRKKHKEGERSSSSSSSSEEKKRKQQTGTNEPHKQGFVEKIKEKAGNIMHKSDKQKTTQ